MYARRELLGTSPGRVSGRGASARTARHAAAWRSGASSTTAQNAAASAGSAASTREGPRVHAAPDGTRHAPGRPVGRVVVARAERPHRLHRRVRRGVGRGLVSASNGACLTVVDNFALAESSRDCIMALRARDGFPLAEVLPRDADRRTGPSEVWL